MSAPGFFSDRVGVLATMHRKEEAIAPILQRACGVRVVVPPDFNTDAFGTFTRDIDRPANQLETARLKARKALEVTGETLAIASEGSFQPHPLFPAIAHNLEVVILLDRHHDLEIVGQVASAQTNYRHCRATTGDEAREFARSVGFPEHGLVVIGDRGTIVKGITTEAQLDEAIETGRSESEDDTVHLETDMRAMYNPTRMKAIAAATEDLARKMQRTCPNCGIPGFDVSQRRPGLPCALCRLPTYLTLAVEYRCQKCDYTQEELFPDRRQTADPGQCQYCNP